jgi:hypothetical protein
LQKNLAARIEHQHMHRAMLQAEPMNLAARPLANHLVALINDIKNFLAHGFVFRVVCGVKQREAQAQYLT